MAYLSVIFDLDGTLLDTLADIAETANEVLAQHGLPGHPWADYRLFVGDGLTSLMRRITPAATDEKTIRSCCSLFIELYAQSWKRNCYPYEGIGAMVSTLRQNGIILAVLSNKPDQFVRPFVKEFFPEDAFSEVCGQRAGWPKKPDPRVALEIAARFRVNPARMLMVGDSAVDIQTGKAAGMATAGVAWGFRGTRELIENNADIIVNSPSELACYALSCP